MMTIQSLFHLFCLFAFIIIGILTLMFIGLVYVYLLFEVIPNKWEEYMKHIEYERKQNKANAKQKNN